MWTIISFLLFSILITPSLTNSMKEENIYTDRFALYKKVETITAIPWYILAAIDQYERNKQDIVNSDQLISITIAEDFWYGIGNLQQLSSEKAITLFNGFGRDGNGDKQAKLDDPEDVLYSFAVYLASYGITKEQIKIGLFDYYQRDLTVQAIMQNAAVFKKFNQIKLTERSFPLPLTSHFTYQNTWGASRGFGGLRIHEGTDIFASYGTPILSTTYGVIELKGWNTFGGWRIGIRDIHNIYHYFAHLQSFAKDIEVGQVVKPGDIIGSVGSSGYGPPGTAGKFPAHLHYGMYKDNGYIEWAFDPYPFLKKWEKTALE